MATAQHLQKMRLTLLRDSDINFLQSCLSSLSNSQSLQELDVWCDASGVVSGCATHLHTYTHSHTRARIHKHHTLDHTTPITCPQGKYVLAVLTNQHQSHMLLSSCIIACTAQKHSNEHTQSSPIGHLRTNTHMQSHAHRQMPMRTLTVYTCTYMHNTLALLLLITCGIYGFLIAFLQL